MTMKKSKTMSEKGVGTKLNTKGNNHSNRSKKSTYKGKYNRKLSNKVSSSSFLMLYTLFFLNKSSEPLYGKEILEKIHTVLGPVGWSPSHGTHYPVLNQMIEDGFINNIKTVARTKYYVITEQGRKELASKSKDFKPDIIESAKLYCNMITEMYGENLEVVFNDNSQVAQ